MTQCSVKVASGPLQARNGLFRFISLKISFVPHPSCDGTNYLTFGIKMTNFSYCTIFISLHGFKAELLTCKNVRAVTSGPLQFVHQINLMKLFLIRGGYQQWKLMPSATKWPLGSLITFVKKIFAFDKYLDMHMRLEIHTLAGQR